MMAETSLTADRQAVVKQLQQKVNNIESGSHEKHDQIDAKIQQVEIRMLPLKRNAHGYGYTYPTLTMLLSHLNPALKELHMAWTSYGTRDRMFVVEVIDLDSHQHRDSCHEYPNVGGDPQKIGSFETYMRRYSLESLLGITAEDDDAQRVSQRPRGRWQGARPVSPVRGGAR